MANPNDFGMVHYETVQLERLKYGAQAMITEIGLRQDLELEAHVETMMRGMVLRLATEVMAERVFTEDQEVPWSGEVQLEVPPATPYKHAWVPFVLAMAMALSALPLRSLAMFVASLVVAGWAVYALAANPPQRSYEKPVRVSGTVTVRASSWRKFPHSTMRYPKELGPVVFHQQIDSAEFYNRVVYGEED